MRPVLSAARLAFAILLASFSAAHADVVRIGGTGASVVTISALAKAVGAESGVAVTALPSLGTAGGLKALNAGRIDLAIIGREMTQDEARAGARIVDVIRTPFVFVTAQQAVPRMSAAELVDAYANPRARWRDGGPIAVVLRQRSDADATVLNRMLTGMAAAVELARKRPEVLVSVVDDDNAEIAARTAGSLATMSYSQWMIEGRGQQAVAIDGVAPSLQALEDGGYPYGRSFFVVVPAAPSAATQLFVAFLQSERGRAALREVHCLPGRAP